MDVLVLFFFVLPVIGLYLLITLVFGCLWAVQMVVRYGRFACRRFLAERDRTLWHLRQIGLQGQRK